MNGGVGCVGGGAVGVGIRGGKGLAIAGTLRGAAGGAVAEGTAGKLVRCVMCVYKEGLPLDV